jgi:hypothetical protein
MLKAIQAFLICAACLGLIFFLFMFIGVNSLQHWVAFRQPQVKREWATERRAELEFTMRQARPIIKAIKSYVADQKTAPKSLQALMPKYLKLLPKPGSASHGSWHLGPYDQEYGSDPRSTLSGGWSLGIAMRQDFCPKHPGLMSFGDYFVYHPSGQYPKYGYRGVMERIGDWAYYHE